MTSRESNQASQQSTGGYNVTARFYDQVYALAAPDDIDFYLELAGHCGSPVLELGCGTGRVALELARAGHSVTGIDSSHMMLAEFRRKLESEEPAVRKRIALVEGRMEQVQLGGKFRLVTMPFRAFQHMLTVEQQQAALATVVGHLDQDGLYVFNVFNPNLGYIVDAMRKGKVWQQDQEWRDAAAGKRYRRFHSLGYDPLNQLISVDWRYEEYDSGGKLLETWCEPMKLRWVYRWEAEHLLEQSGFEITASYGAYDKSPMDAFQGDLIYVCRKRN